MVEPELIRAAQSGDRDALITLLREIEQHVYRTAYYILNNEQDALDLCAGSVDPNLHQD